MSQPPAFRQRVLNINANSPQAEGVLRALASEPRQRILEILSDHVYNVSEIASLLGMPLSTTTLHVTILEEAGLVRTELQPATRGRQKVCARTYDIIMVNLAYGGVEQEQVIEASMPIGAYVDCAVTPTCGLASANGIIGLFDDAASFYEPERIQAQLLWFHQGYVEYRFPNRIPLNAALESVHLTLEMGSEAPLHHADWPSDVTVWINQIEVGTWTCPGDFGGQRGVLTPLWWEGWNSQYGLLKSWQVSTGGSFIDGIKLSSVGISQLGIMEQDYISVRIGVKPDAQHVGGINIFGRAFGNYPQDISLRCRYHQSNRKGQATP